MYYEGLERALDLTAEQDRLAIYTNMREKKTYASLPKKLPLSFVTGQYTVIAMLP